MKVSEKVGNGLMNNCLNFSGDPNHCLDTGIVFRIRHYWEIRKVINGLLILIRQMPALARRALAKVCTVPELLVLTATVKSAGRCDG